MEIKKNITANLRELISQRKAKEKGEEDKSSENEDLDSVIMTEKLPLSEDARKRLEDFNSKEKRPYKARTQGNKVVITLDDNYSSPLIDEVKKNAYR